MELSLDNVIFSKTDVKRGVRMPSLLTTDLAEEIGMHIGDGSMNKYSSYLYSLRGDVKGDNEYYRKHVAHLFKKLYNMDVNLREWPDVIGFQAASTALCTFKCSLGLPMGPKTDVEIPKSVFAKKELLWACVRGIFDTDGNINFDKGGYPRIEIATTSEPLFKQLRHIIGGEFNYSTWIVKYKNPNWRPLYKICVRGHQNTRKWFQIVGSSNPKNIAKYRAAVA